MPFSLHLQARATQVAAELERTMNAPGDELAHAALAIARVEYPSLGPAPYVAQLDRMGGQAAARLAKTAPGREASIRAFNEYFYDEQGFTGNRDQYDDPRNSFLNEVLERRTGIPISLAVVYMEVARRAGLRVEGVNFPGHFLLRVPAAPQSSGGSSSVLIVDPFHGGALLSEVDCVELLRRHAGEEAAFDAALLAPANRHQVVVRMLVNLKRLYVHMRSFPQARFISDLLLAVDPSAIAELRDRGLLAFHLEDFSAALRDLEAYLRLVPKRSEPEGGELEAGAQRDDDSALWEHVKTLRKRVAGFN